METVSVRVLYRPVRMGWCVTTGDMAALRNAWRASHAFWGGRYNPVIPIDQPELATSLIEAFRVDALWAMSDAPAVKAFIEKQTQLPDPFFHDQLFVKNGDREDLPILLDLRHPLRLFYDEFLKNNPTPNYRVLLYEWTDDDPLADVFLCTLGSLPHPEMTGIDYKAAICSSLNAQSVNLTTEPYPVPPDERTYSVAALGRMRLRRHYVVGNNWDFPGFDYGDVSNFDDLVAFWNLRAADISVVFFDAAHPDRFSGVREKWSSILLAAKKSRLGDGPRIALWSRTRDENRDLSLFGKGLTVATCDTAVWGRRNLSPPFMYLSEGTSLAAISAASERPRISFQLPPKPFDDDHSHYMQHMVVSVDPGIAFFRDERNTLSTPFIPQLNEYFGRECLYEWNKARAEPETLGVITDANTTDLSLRALGINELVQKLFEVAGISATPSKPGLVATRLIQQMGGLDDCRALKIKGVRDLIAKYGPDKSFTRSAAVQLIRDKKPSSNEVGFTAYEDLYLEPRPHGGKLTPDAVFKFLLQKNLFRAGLQFICPNCQLEFWKSLDDLTTNTVCAYCGNSFNVTPHLRDRDWAYRRSGLLGRADNQEGAIPVVLTLQQLRRTASIEKSLYCTGMELRPSTTEIAHCETDFVFVRERGGGDAVQIAIGECKTGMPITSKDASNLRAVAKALEQSGFEAFVIFAKLRSFSAEEISACAEVNEKYRRRAILLTDRELEPYRVYERTAKEFTIPTHRSGLQGMAEVTQQLYFAKGAPLGQPPSTADGAS